MLQIYNRSSALLQFCFAEFLKPLSKEYPEPLQEGDQRRQVQIGVDQSHHAKAFADFVNRMPKLNNNACLIFKIVPTQMAHGLLEFLYECNVRITTMQLG